MKGVQPWAAASRWAASARADEGRGGAGGGGGRGGGLPPRGGGGEPPRTAAPALSGARRRGGGRAGLRRPARALPPVLPQPLARGARQLLLLPAGEVGVQSWW